MIVGENENIFKDFVSIFIKKINFNESETSILPMTFDYCIGHLSSFDIGNTSFDEGCTIGLTMH